MVAAIPHTEAAARLQLSEGAVRVAVHRLRKRYRELLRDESPKPGATPSK